MCVVWTLGRVRVWWGRFIIFIIVVVVVVVVILMSARSVLRSSSRLLSVLYFCARVEVLLICQGLS